MRDFARFVVLPDERGLILGRSFGSMFKSGVIYQAHSIIGETLIKEIGAYSLPDKAPDYPNRHSETGAIIESGRHLYTVDEWAMMCRSTKDL